MKSENIVVGFMTACVLVAVQIGMNLKSSEKNTERKEAGEEKAEVVMPKTRPSPVIKLAPEEMLPIKPKAVPLPPSSKVEASPSIDAEEYRRGVLSKTKGAFAHEFISLLDTEKLYNNHQDMCNLISESESVGLSTDQIKRQLGDELYLSLVGDPEMSLNIASGLIDGAILWGCD